MKNIFFAVILSIFASCNKPETTSKIKEAHNVKEVKTEITSKIKETKEVKEVKEVISQKDQIKEVKEVKTEEYNKEFFDKLQKDDIEYKNYHLAQFYFYGFNVVKVDPLKGLEYLKKGLENNDIYSSLMAGIIYMTGYDKIEKNIEEGKKIIEKFLPELKKNAENNCKLSFGFLADLHHRGFVVSHDEKLSFESASKGAQMGDHRSIIIKSYHHYSGIGTDENVDEAVKLITPLAEKGHSLAEFSLGYFYENNFGSLTWLRKSADQNMSQAEFLLGLKYLKGAGVEQDNEKGYLHIKKSAELGNEKAKEFLNKFKEIPVKKDYTKNQGLK